MKMYNPIKNKKRNILEISLFLLCNLFICIGPFCLMILLGAVLTFITKCFFVIDKDVESAIYLEMMLSVMYFVAFKYFFKIFAFPILYYFKNQFPIIHKFFNKYRTDLRFMFFVIGTVILLDLLSVITDIIVCRNDSIYSIILNLFGLLPAYIIFLLFFPPIAKKNNIDKNGNIIEEYGPIRKKIVKFIVYSSIVLFAIILLLIICDFILH